VWRALTAPDALKQWAPFDADRDLGTLGEATLFMEGERDGEREAHPCVVRLAEKERVLEHSWGEDLLRWELEPIGSGTRLTLRHTTDDKGWTPKTAAGWHICFDVMERWLDGEPLGRIVGKDAASNGWQELNAAYAERFGIENTGLPEHLK
jgi:uncharacterized protein YndB with AHSA1/START domain